MNVGALAVLDAGLWASASVVVGYAAARLPAHALDHDTFLTRIRPWERDGERYEQIGVRQWKDLVFEAGAAFGGISKKHLPGRSPTQLATFANETRRAELVHWTLLAIGPAFLLWNPPALSAAMLVYAVFANVPFIVIQRYNRARVERIIERTHVRSPR